MSAPRFHIETLGCPKNAVDSDKIVVRCSPTAWSKRRRRLLLTW
jgi:tRNA A37 methylthiotransferase MiaB